MPATINRMSVAPTFSNTNVSYVKNIMTLLGIPTTNIVFETTTEAIYKITNGTGTYADTYLRFYLTSAQINGTFANTWTAQLGTGIASNALTGAGTGNIAININGASQSSSWATYYTTVVSSDGSYRQLMHFDSTSVYRGGFAIAQPTNTTLTAASAPLTYFCAAQIDNNTGASALRYIYSTAPAQYGPITATRNLALSATSTLSTVYGLTNAKAGAYGVQPNVPILSGGWNIGHNINLGFSNSSFLLLDRIIVSPGIEEWVICDTATGLAVREV